jgi:hypothetical protein
MEAARVAIAFAAAGGGTCSRDRAWKRVRMRKYSTSAGSSAAEPRQALHASEVLLQLPEFLVAYAVEFSIGARHEILSRQDPAGIAGRRQDQQRRCRERE